MRKWTIQKMSVHRQKHFPWLTVLMFAHKLWLWSPLRCNIPIIHLLLAVVTARYRCPGHSPALGTTLLPALNKYFKWGKNNTRRRQKTPVLSQLWAGLRTETSCRNTTDGAPPSPSPPETYFILKGILFLTQQTQLLLLQKILVCFCFVSLSTFVGHVHCAVTRVSEPGGDVIERFPLPQNICRQQPEWVCQVQKFVGAGAGYICGPNYSDIGAYVQRVRDTWSAGAGGSVSMTHVPDIGRD